MKPVVKYWLLATLIIWILTLATCKNHIENDLTSKSLKTLEENNLSGINVESVGRDLQLSGETLNQNESESIVTMVEGVDGVRIADHAFSQLPPLVERARSSLDNGDLSWVNVNGDNTTINLSGEALEESHITTASNSVKNLRGLETLNNNISLLPPLVERAQARINDANLNWASVEGDNSNLILSGIAGSEADKALAAKQLENLRGLENLENKISVSVSLLERAKSALNENNLSWAQVEGQNSKLTISGLSPDQDDADTAIASLQKLKGLTELDNQITVLPPLIDRAKTVLSENNAQWATVISTGSDLTVSGETIDSNIADKLHSELQTLAGIGQVTNDITVLQKLDSSNCQAMLNELLAGEKIEFESGSAIIDANSQQLLYKLANTSRRCPESSIVVMGHTDNTGDSSFNVQLSKDRATAVLNNLVNLGVNTQRLKALGYGPTYPIDTNDTEEGRQKNRRIEFKVN